MEKQSQLITSLGSYQNVQQIGFGATSIVFVRHPKSRSDKKIAIKVFRHRAWQDGSTIDITEDDVKFEFIVAKNLNNNYCGKKYPKNLIQIINSQPKKTIFKGITLDVMQMEYGQGDWIQYLSQYNSLRIKKWFVDLLTGLEALHANGYAHGDIRLNNLLLGQDNELKITDFGSAMDIKQPQSEQKTAWYCYPPQSQLQYDEHTRKIKKNNQRYDKIKADIFSAGLVFLQMIAPNIKLFDQAKPQKSFNFQLKDEKDYQKLIPDFLQKTQKPRTKLENFIYKMLNPDPKKRYSIKDLFKDDWLNVEIDREKFNQDLKKVKQKKKKDIQNRRNQFKGLHRQCFKKRLLDNFRNDYEQVENLEKCIDKYKNKEINPQPYHVYANHKVKNFQSLDWHASLRKLFYSKQSIVCKGKSKNAAYFLSFLRYKLPQKQIKIVNKDWQQGEGPQSRYVLELKDFEDNLSQGYTVIKFQNTNKKLKQVTVHIKLWYLKGYDDKDLVLQLQSVKQDSDSKQFISDEVIKQIRTQLRTVKDDDNQSNQNDN